MATVELALAIPAAVVLITALIAGIVGVGSQLKCVDAAREGARAAARGESPAVVQQIALEIAPDGAQVSVMMTDETVTVTVRATFKPLGGRLGAFTLDAEATARVEPSAQDAGP